jgi:DNA-3-methyladenine glycosylase I
MAGAKKAETKAGGGKAGLRCWGGDPGMTAYHDREWGTPLHDDRKIFEFLILEGMQAGLSWRTILDKRENFRRAFHGFDPVRIARYTDRDVRRLLGDAGIIRNRLKILAAVNNAKRFLEVRREFGSFDRYIWGFVGGQPVASGLKSFSKMPARTPLSDRISRDLKARGFKFVGSTIVYSHMQATGMVNDHLVTCFRYGEINRAGGLDGPLPPGRGPKPCRGPWPGGPSGRRARTPSAGNRPPADRRQRPC